MLVNKGPRARTLKGLLHEQDGESPAVRASSASQSPFAATEADGIDEANSKAGSRAHSMKLR